MDPLIDQCYDAERFREEAHRVVDMLADHLAGSYAGQHTQALPWQEPLDAVRHWRQMAEQGTDLPTLCDELLRHSVRISDPKFLGHQICTPAPTAVLTGLITDCLNNGSGVYEMGMAGTAMEKVVLRIVADQLGLPEDSDGLLTSGGTLANLTALLAARAAQESQDWTEGTRQPWSIMVSEQAHYCIERAVRIMGWGQAGVVSVPTDAEYRMDVQRLPDLLDQAKEQGRRVIGVVGSACSTSTGSFDDLAAIAKFCQQHGLWFHVDGAHGAAVAFSKRWRHLLSGIEQADSVVLDFHKMLMTPVINSGLLFRRRLDSYRAFAVEADYLFARAATSHELDEFNLARRTFECTKRMLSAKIFSILAVHGVQTLEANVDRLHATTQHLVRMLDERADFELAIRPQTNIVCYRYCAGPPKQLSRLNARIRDQLTCQGHYYIVQTTLRGQTWLRSTVANPLTGTQELQGLLESIADWGQRCLSEPDFAGESAS